MFYIEAFSSLLFSTPQSVHVVRQMKTDSRPWCAIRGLPQKACWQTIEKHRQLYTTPEMLQSGTGGLCTYMHSSILHLQTFTRE